MRLRLLGSGLLIFTVQIGQFIRIIDVAGEPVADLVCFARQMQQLSLHADQG